MAHEIRRGILVMVIGVPPDAEPYDFVSHLDYLGHVGEVLCIGAELVEARGLDPRCAGAGFLEEWIVEGAGDGGPQMPILSWPSSCLMPIEPPEEAWYEATKTVNCRCTVHPLLD